MADIFEEALASIGAGMADVGQKYQEVFLGQSAPGAPDAGGDQQSNALPSEPSMGGSLHKAFSSMESGEGNDPFSAALKEALTHAPGNTDQGHGIER